MFRVSECEPCRGMCPCYGGGTSLSQLVFPTVIREPLIPAPGEPLVPAPGAAPVGLNTTGEWLSAVLVIVAVLGMMIGVVWQVMRLLIVVTFTNVRQFVIDADIAAGRDPVVSAVVADGVGWVIAALITAVAAFAVNRARVFLVGLVVPAATVTVPVPSPMNNRREPLHLQRGRPSRVRTPTTSSPLEVPRFQRARQPTRPGNLSAPFLRHPITSEEQAAVELLQPAVEPPQPVVELPQPVVELPEPVVEPPQPARAPAADPVVLPPVTLNQLAENASILLDLFSQGSHDNDIVSDEHHTIITNATAGVLAINARLRQANQRARPREEVVPEPDCIICFAECADTLFMPCKHMVVCTVRISSTSRGQGR